MKNSKQTNITNRIITLKQFMQYIGLKNRASGRKHYNNYLAAVGKPDCMPLTNIDLFKLDGKTL